MSVIAAKKCGRHPAREAVGRCASCNDHFCRECVGEHAGVLLCAACLVRESAAAAPTRRRDWRRVGEWILTASAVLLLWVAFYSFGQFLKIIPADVHEGTVWHPEDS